MSSPDTLADVAQTINELDRGVTASIFNDGTGQRHVDRAEIPGPRHPALEAGDRGEVARHRCREQHQGADPLNWGRAPLLNPISECTMKPTMLIPVRAATPMMVITVSFTRRLRGGVTLP